MTIVEKKITMIPIRIELAMHCQLLGGFAEKYPSDRMVVNFARFLSYALILRDAYNEIENVYIANSTLKIQIEILKEMLLSISEIRDNKIFNKKFKRNLQTNTMFGMILTLKF